MADFLNEPTHLLVQKQIEDVVRTQQAACQKLSQQVSVREDSVCLGQYEELLRELEDEKLAHAETKAQKMAVEDKLQFALGEIEVLTKQLDRENMQFEQAFGLLKNKAMKETSKNIQLENKCFAIERQRREQQDDLSSKDESIESLSQKLQEQRESHSKQLSELEVQKQQELYIARMLQENEHKHKKRKGILKKP